MGRYIFLMNTPTHILIAAALLTRKLPPEPEMRSQIKMRNFLVIFGAVLPDLSMFIFFLWTKLFTTASPQEVWGTLYWQDPWQSLSAISNSIPLMLLICLVGWHQRRKTLQFIGLAMLLHVGFDLPFHADDAHIHFWPLTDFRFHSPLSYWDKDHHAAWVSILELSILGLAGTILWRRFSSLCVRLISIAPFITQGSVLLFLFIKSFST